MMIATKEVLTPGEWFCHSSCGIGGDIFNLEQKLSGTNFKAAKKTIFEMVGRSPRLSSSKPPVQASGSLLIVRNPSSEGRAKTTILAVRVREALVSDGFQVTTSFEYGPNLRKVRFEHSSQKQPDKNRPEKTFRWEHRIGDDWYSGDGGLKKPLYVNQIFRDRDQVGLAAGFEGEGKADIAGTLGLAAFSFKDIGPEHASTLDGCDVVLWPDNDASGYGQAAAAAKVLLTASGPRSVGALQLPKEFPVAGDVVDAVEKLGWDSAKVLDLVRSANPFRPAPDAKSRGCDQVAGPEDNSSSEAAVKSDYASTFPFLVQPDGVFFRKDSEDSAEPVRISSRIDVVAKTRNEGAEDWGRVLAWLDEESHPHQWAIPMEALASDAAGVRARLLAGGLPFITTNSRMRERFSQYLQTAPTDKYIRCISRVGWSGNSFVLPDKVIGPEQGEQLLYQPANDSAQHYWNSKGTAAEWKENVGALCRGNSRLVVAVSCGFAGPLLTMVGSESGGIHFHGGSSTGKSTALVVGGSVCGGGGKFGFVQTWRSTVNGLEVMAEGHNDGTLFLDELAQVDPRAAAETAYMLGNGQGKSRMTKGLGARKRLTWNLLMVSSREVTLAEHASSAGNQTRARVEVRLVNIEADAGREMGMIEELNGAPSPDALVRNLKDAAQRYYGTVFREFLQGLTYHRSEVARAIAEARKTIGECLPSVAAGELGRVADRFALIAAAGTLATRWGLTGWGEPDSTEAAKRCLSDWIKSRGTATSSDVEAAVGQLRAFLERHGSSRFQSVNARLAEDSSRIVNRAGFRRPAGEETEYLILKDTFRAEICCGYNHRAVAKELERRGFLIREDHSLMIKARLPELGAPTRVYGIRAAILDGEEC
jgi:putative DNA primase/helicase